MKRTESTAYAVTNPNYSDEARDPRPNRSTRERESAFPPPTQAQTTEKWSERPDSGLLAPKHQQML
jgi:hypothetical protein